MEITRLASHLSICRSRRQILCRLLAFYLYIFPYCTCHCTWNVVVFFNHFIFSLLGKWFVLFATSCISRPLSVNIAFQSQWLLTNILTCGSKRVMWKSEFLFCVCELILVQHSPHFPFLEGMVKTVFFSPMFCHLMNYLFSLSYSNPIEICAFPNYVILYLA